MMQRAGQGNGEIIVCIGDFPLGSRRAHAINVVKTSGGFARLGHDVLLLCREPEGGEAVERLLASYGEPGLRVEMLPEPGEKRFPHGSDARCLPFARWAVERGLAAGAAVMYARQADAAVLWARTGRTAIAETHAYIGDSKPGFVRLLEATRGPTPVAALSTISWRLKEHYVSRGADAGRVHVIPDGVDVEMFARPEGGGGSAASARGGDRPLAVYAGHLYDYKGIPTVLDAAAMMPGARFELIGGLEEDIARVRRRVAERGLANVEVVGWVEHSALPERLWRADVLLLPPGLGDPSRDWTSPVKLGEYLAAGAPIVASGIPALRDWVDEPVVAWFEPDDAGSLARAVERALGEGAAAATRRRGLAMELARRWSYESRARAMLEAAGVGRSRPTMVAAERR